MQALYSEKRGNVSASSFIFEIKSSFLSTLTFSINELIRLFANTEITFFQNRIWITTITFGNDDDDDDDDHDDDDDDDDDDGGDGVDDDDDDDDDNDDDDDGDDDDH